MDKTRFPTAFVFVLLAATAASAQEWTQWRGPARDGSVSVKNAPVAWPASLQRSWRVEIGEGYSSPVVAAGRVFVHGRKDPEELVASINLADGKVLWQQKYQANFQKNQYAVEMAKGTEPAKIKGAKKWNEGPKHVSLDAIFLTPIPITQDNLNLVIDAGWVKKDVVCQGVDKAKGPKACQ